MDVHKLRFQLRFHKKQNSVMDCAHDIHRKEGAGRNLQDLVSYKASHDLMNIPYAIVMGSTDDTL